MVLGRAKVTSLFEPTVVFFADLVYLLFPAVRRATTALSIVEQRDVPLAYDFSQACCLLVVILFNLHRSPRHDRFTRHCLELLGHRLLLHVMNLLRLLLLRHGRHHDRLRLHGRSGVHILIRLGHLLMHKLLLGVLLRGHHAHLLLLGRLLLRRSTAACALELQEELLRLGMVRLERRLHLLLLGLHVLRLHLLNGLMWLLSWRRVASVDHSIVH